MIWEIRILSNGLLERKERVCVFLWGGVDGESRGREGSEVKGESVSFSFFFLCGCISRSHDFSILAFLPSLKYKSSIIV